MANDGNKGFFSGFGRGKQEETTIQQAEKILAEEETMREQAKNEADEIIKSHKTSIVKPFLSNRIFFNPYRFPVCLFIAYINPLICITVFTHNLMQNENSSSMIILSQPPSSRCINH